VNTLPSADPIEHVVLLMLENRSFDQTLGSLSSVYPNDLDGIPQTPPPYFNKDASGTVYEQLPTGELQMALDPDHDNGPVLEQIAGGNQGFIKDFIRKYPRSTPAQRRQIMGYYEFPSLPALHTLGDNFVVCDRWFSSLPGPTWPNRFFALSGTSRGQVKMPDGIWHPDIDGFFNQTQDTIFDRLNEAGKEWTIYHYDMACSWVLVHQRRLENLARYKTMGFFFDDVANGVLPPFTFLEPKYNGQDQNDDHPPHNIMKGEKLIADVYNALRTSPQWEKTLLVVLFDEHGGFYDHVTPPKAVPPDEFVGQYAFNQFGVRVPAILVSPWLARGVAHNEFDHTSLLKYLIEKWGLKSLTKRVDAAASIADAMHFLPAPRRDTVRSIRVRTSDLYAPMPELEAFDKSPHHVAFGEFGDYLARRRADAGGTVPPFPKPQAGLRQWMGRTLMGWGRALSTAQEDSAARTVALQREVGAAQAIDEQLPPRATAPK